MKFTNILSRVIVSFIAIPIILALTIFGKYLFLIFVGLILFISLYEFYKLSTLYNLKHNYILGYIFAFSVLLLFYFRMTAHISLAIFLFIALITLFELSRKRNNSIFNSSVTVFVPLILSLFFSSLVGIREFFGEQDSADYIKGGYVISSLLASIWICDSAAYFGGSAFGKHKLLERISPKKSIEGALFGFVFSVVSMVIAKYWILDFMSWVSIITIALIVGIIGQLGDLVESMFKRNSGIKDSSGLIPGHGGVFDRFDSLLYVAPFVYFYLVYFYNL